MDLAGESKKTESRLTDNGRSMKENLRKILNMMLLSMIAGIIAGGACVLFYALTQLCDDTRVVHPWLLWLLPAAGLVIVITYDGMLGDEDLSSGALFRHVQEGKPVPRLLALMITLSTCLAYLTGGSVGRTGSALQAGGGITAGILERRLGRRFGAGIPGPRSEGSRKGRTDGPEDKGAVPDEGRTDGPEDKGAVSGEARPPGGTRLPEEGRLTDGARPAEEARLADEAQPEEDFRTLMVVCGISAGFTAVLNTPLAGAVFGVEVLVFQRRRLIMLLPSLITSLITWGIAEAAGVEYTDFSVPAERFAAVTPEMIAKIALLAFAATFVARLFCYSRRMTAWGFARMTRDPYLRVLAGTVLVILLTKASGTMDYNGVGFTYTAEALAGSCAGGAFLWKMALTVLTLGCGIRGGEIAPCIFIGATFGCSAAALIGLDPCLCAAVCLVCVLSSATNCTLAVFLYGCEAIGLTPYSAGLFLLVSVIAHVLSGDTGIYREQPSERIAGKIHIR